MAANVTVISGAEQIGFYLRNYTWANMVSDMPALTLGEATDLDKPVYCNTAGDPKKLMIDGSGSGNMSVSRVPYTNSDGELISTANFTHDGTDTAMGGSLSLVGSLTVGTVASQSTDPDKFLCVDGSGVVKYRTGAEVLSDIGAGTGSVDTSGTPADNQIAVFTDADTIEGSANLTHDGTDTTLGGALTIPEYIVHAGDADTYIGYNAADSFVACAGGVTGLRVAPGEVEVNPNAVDQDFVVNWDSGEAIAVDGATGAVSVDETLDVDGYVHSETAVHLTGALLGGQTPGTDGSTIEVDDGGDGDLDFINHEQSGGFRFSRTDPNPDETLLQIGTDTLGRDVFTVAKYDYSGSSTINGWSGTPTSEIYCKRVGNTCHVWFRIVGTGSGTAANAVNFTVPWQNDTDDSVIGVARTVDNSTANGGYCTISDNSSTMYVYKQYDSTATWTNAVNRYVQGYICYETNDAI